MWVTRCQATTLKGRRCKKKKSDEHFCNIHIPKPEQEPLNCPVCYNDVQESTVLSCNHVFCNDCIFTWICKKNHNNCPICRTEITDLDLKSNAWKYGVEKKLLFVAYTNVYDVNKLTPEEYDLLKEHIITIENKFLTTTEYLLAMLAIEETVSKIFHKLIKDPIRIKRLFRLPDGQTELNEQEYHQIVNRTFL